MRRAPGHQLIHERMYRWSGCLTSILPHSALAANSGLSPEFLVTCHTRALNHNPCLKYIICLHICLSHFVYSSVCTSTCVSHSTYTAVLFSVFHKIIIVMYCKSCKISQHPQKPRQRDQHYPKSCP